MPNKQARRNQPLKGMVSKPVPPADTHPYLTQKRWGNPDYHQNLQAAQSFLIKQLEADEFSFGQLGDKDTLAAIQALKAQVSDIGVDGGRVAGVLDPYSGIKYQADIVLRRPV